MCGINGIYNLKNITDPQSTIANMNATSQHRGPDATGVFVDDYVALGHNRLSIIDLSEGANQPFYSADNRYTIVFNGEVYNYKEIREQLKDYSFTTDSDTEVVLAAYIKWGEKCLGSFNGMFAFAVWDKVERQMFIGRDRLGIKPLYFYDNNDSFIFSSELRSLLACQSIPRKIDKNAFVDYLRYNTVHAPNTIIEGVKMLLPGHYIKLREDLYENKKYWDPNIYINRSSDTKSYEEIKSDVRSLLEESVRKRLIADVPFGAFLSGGIDSSAVVALMSKVSPTKIKTFNISFAEEEFSEAKYARMIAEKYQTDHTEIKLSPDDFLKDLPKAMESMDHPSGDGPNSYIVSKVTKESGVTMALSGLGGDELFAGYDIFPRAVSLLDKKWLFSFPIGIRKLMGKGLQILKPSIASDKIVETITRKYLELPYYYPINRQVLMDKSIKRLTGEETLPENEVFNFGIENIDVNAPGFKSPFLSKVSFMEMYTYMQNVLLRDADQMSMAHALEVRVPFLDHNLVEYVYGVDDKWKFPYTPKKLLVDSLSDLLPDEIVNRPKMGFTLPWEKWMKKELKDFCEENLKALTKRELLIHNELWKLWEAFLKGDKNTTWSRIWPLVVLGYWLDKNEIES